MICFYWQKPAEKHVAPSLIPDLHKPLGSLRKPKADNFEPLAFWIQTISTEVVSNQYHRQ